MLPGLLGRNMAHVVESRSSMDLAEQFGYKNELPRVSAILSESFFENTLTEKKM
jgi:hypothetical protein